MNKKFENVYYDKFVGDIELFNDKLVFRSDLNSCNPGNCTIEIPFIDINVEKQIEIINRVGSTNRLMVITNDEAYEFQFNQWIEDYEEVCSFILKQIKPS